MSNSVAQQVHELGVRMAIGASPVRYSRWSSRGELLGAGIALGLIGAVWSAQLLAVRLAGIND
jgi:hypothetical protein